MSLFFSSFTKMHEGREKSFETDLINNLKLHDLFTWNGLMAEILPMFYFQYIKNVFCIKMLYKITPNISRENSYCILRVMKWFSCLWEFKFVEEIHT